MRIIIGLNVLLLALLAATVQAGEQAEKKISVSDCPEVVQKTLKHEVGNGKIVDVDVRTIDGVAIYESEVRYGDLEYDIVIRGDGTLLAKLLENDGDDRDSDEGDDGKDVDDEECGKDSGGEDASDEAIETSIRMADLPKPVLETLTREARGGDIEEIEKETKGDKVVYEAEVEFGEKEYEIQIGDDGTLLRKVLEEKKSGDERKSKRGDADDDDENGNDDGADDKNGDA